MRVCVCFVERVCVCFVERVCVLESKRESVCVCFVERVCFVECVCVCERERVRERAKRALKHNPPQCVANRSDEHQKHFLRFSSVERMNGCDRIVSPIFPINCL